MPIIARIDKLGGYANGIAIAADRALQDVADAEAFGDERCSAIVTRDEAQAFSETELMSTEPVTVVLSERGWVRAAKGHDVDPASLQYKSGDGFKFAAKGRSNSGSLAITSRTCPAAST